ncbi:hypothetical protein [Methylococcus geothermalis]|uniref:Cytochrome c domain-containing protein n=1 Tax=Methylococcus geothermalis TaxID=2681310 RepID=A0A858Q7R1_9GAMM|nr:hypothetical protein [Methylococcus geothermalis]QJD29835.1 hypothetical protein GNH96_07525 [Methylococcus geothermalis]
MKKITRYSVAKAGIFFTASVFLPMNGTAAALRNSANSSGISATFGDIDRRNDFFNEFGGNGRTCLSCHRPGEGWSITPQGMRKRFDRSDGTDPAFRPNDGSNSPDADVSTVDARRLAYSALLNKGLIRIGLPIPASAEFTLTEADDPYGFVSKDAANPDLSLFRRPLPAANLKFASSVMWDGRESPPTFSIREGLGNQANSANTQHAQGAELTAAQRQSIVDFELSLFASQISVRDSDVSIPLGKAASPKILAEQRFSLGINPPFLAGRANSAFDNQVFKLFDRWSGRPDRSGSDRRAAIARGQQIFNTRTFVIKGVAGLNDSALFGKPEQLTGTCGTCHNTPNVGNSSSALFMNTGVSDADRRTGDLPLYTLTNKTTGESIQTTDPGRAMVTGLWKDIGCFKVPALRGLAARPPYFHNGSRSEIPDVVDFYETRFGLGLNNRERLDLISFLRAL